MYNDLHKYKGVVLDDSNYQGSIKHTVYKGMCHEKDVKISDIRC